MIRRQKCHPVTRKWLPTALTDKVAWTDKHQLDPSECTRHGLLAIGITELDDDEAYYATLKDLTSEKKPSWRSGEILWSRPSLSTSFGGQGARRLEAEYVTGILHPAAVREETRWTTSILHLTVQ